MSRPSPSPLTTPQPWDLVASDYTAEVVPIFERFAVRALELAACPDGGRVIDVACGPGTLALLAAKRAGHVDAIDFSPAMVERLRARVAEAGVSNVACHVGNGQALPFASEHYDAGFSMFGLMFFPDRGRGFGELQRVLKPGARAVVSSWAPMDATPFLAATFAALQAHVPDLPPPPASSPLTQDDDVRAEMTSGGFHDVAVHRVDHVVRSPSTREAWAMFERTTAPIALIRRGVGDAWPAISAKILADLVAKFGEGEQSLTMTALLGVGIA